MRENIYSQRKLGPLAFTTFEHTFDLGVSRISDDILIVDSSYLDESYLFYSSKDKFDEVEEELRKSRKFAKPSNLNYHEYEKSFTFNNPSYNKVKGYPDDRECTGIIKAGWVVPYNNLIGVDLVFQTRDYIIEVLNETVNRVSRSISKNGHLTQVKDRIEYKKKKGQLNSIRRLLGFGGMEEKQHYSTEIDKSRIDLQTMVNHSLDKVTKSYSKEEKDKMALYAGVVIFRLLLTDSEKSLESIYSI